MSTPRDYAAELERCEREIAACVEYDGPDAYGAAWGWADWLLERELIREEMEANA